jgi:hypothetical protein
LLKETILDEVVEPVISDMWRASEAGEECEAFLCHTRLGHQPLPMKGRIRHLLDDGNVHEDDVVARLKNGGIDAQYTGNDQMYVHCVNEGGVIINGHPDGLLHKIPVELRKLDWVDEHFSWDSDYHLLEITAPNTFSFAKYFIAHLEGVNPRKFVQTHLYLGSEELYDKMHCAVVIVKNKMTSELYEEGLTFNQAVIDRTIEKLKHVQDLVAKNQVSAKRCTDWHKDTCKFRQYCFNEEELTARAPIAGLLDADKLLESVELHQALDNFLQGKEFKDMGEGLIEEAKAYFADILDSYGKEAVLIGQKKAKWSDSHWSGIDSDTLELKYPTIYEEVHITKPTHFISVVGARKNDRPD